MRVRKNCSSNRQQALEAQFESDQTLHNSKSTDSKANNEHKHPLLVEFDDELDAIDKHPTVADKIQEYMHWHYRLNHASFNTMLNMAKQKTTTKRNIIHHQEH